MQAQDSLSPLGYRPAQAAVMLGCTERTIYRRLKDGDLRAKKIHGLTLITSESLHALMNGSRDWQPLADALAASA